MLFFYFLVFLGIISPIFSHVIITDKKQERYNNFGAFDRDENEKTFFEPAYEYPAVTRTPIYHPPITPSPSPITTRHTHILRIPNKDAPLPLSVAVPEAVVYIGAMNQKYSANSFALPSYAKDETKNVEIFTSGNSINQPDSIKEEPIKEKVRYRDILVALALWNLANTFNQYETGSSESSSGTTNDLLDGFQIEPISQEIKLRSDEIIQHHKSTD